MGGRLAYYGSLSRLALWSMEGVEGMEGSRISYGWDYGLWSMVYGLWSGTAFFFAARVYSTFMSSIVPFYITGHSLCTGSGPTYHWPAPAISVCTTLPL